MPRTPSSIYSVIPALVLFLSSCAQKPFSIEGEDFPASGGCNGEGVFDIQTEAGEVKATARGEIQVELLVGGTMGTCSYVLLGTETGMSETFGSTCHGAGRAWSRAKSRCVSLHLVLLCYLVLLSYLTISYFVLSLYLVLSWSYLTLLYRFTLLSYWNPIM